MKFGLPLLTTELSGSMGGATASSSRGGTGYFRRRAVPGNPRTTFQTIVRSILASIAAAWVSQLTSGQRADWEGISAADSSGIDSFVKGNAQRLIGGKVRVDNAPVALSFANPPVVVTPVPDASAHTVSVTFDALQLGYTNMYVSAPQNVSRAARQFGYQYASTSALDATGATALAIPVGHPAYNMTTGDIVYVKLVAFSEDSGQVAIAQEFRCVVVA